MKVDKLYAGLVAAVAGLALSAGSSFAQTTPMPIMGYTTGDVAMMKLIPYYETGEMKATIIGIQNMSPQEQDTMNKNMLVMDLERFLDGDQIDSFTPATPATRRNNLIGAIKAANTSLTVGATTRLTDTNLNLKAAAEKALEKAKMAAHTEHLFITVKVYDAMGMMMDKGSASLCLAENQFGVVVLQDASRTAANNNQMRTFSVMDEDIAASGYVQVEAGSGKFTACAAVAPKGLDPVITHAMPPTLGVNGRPESATASNTGTTGAMSKLATWAIIQDTGDGFFGAEVPTSTISMARNVKTPSDLEDDGPPELACYTTITDNGSGTSNDPANNPNKLPYNSGPFKMDRCGLIPERHTMRRNADGTVMLNNSNAAQNATPNAHAYARYDVGDEARVHVWLAKGMDTERTRPSLRRHLMVSVMCEDGTVQMKPNEDGVMAPTRVPAPSMITVIDPTMGPVGELTERCEGDRGVLDITMPTGSHAGMVFTHITQLMGHYRMNFPGYSVAEHPLPPPPPPPPPPTDPSA